MNLPSNLDVDQQAVLTLTLTALNQLTCLRRLEEPFSENQESAEQFCIDMIESISAALEPEDFAALLRSLVDAWQDAAEPKAVTA